jgi:hypothetical protein
MRFFHPLYKLKAPGVTTNEGICADLIKAFQTEHRHNIYNIFLKGQNALPIRQHDVDTASTAMKGLTNSPLIKYEARIRSLEREVQDLMQQLSEPLETDPTETSFLDKAFSTLEKIKKLRGKNDG